MSEPDLPTPTAAPTVAAGEPDSPILIVGAGQAGGECAAELRRQGYVGRIVMVGEEDELPYKRPALSKGYLAGTVPAEQLLVMQPAAFEKAGIELHRGRRVTELHPEARTVVLDDGRRLAYAKLALCTGGRARPLMVPGHAADNVFALRTRADVEALRPHLEPGRRLVIVGGGFIGLETAAVAVKMGLQVTVLEGLPRVLARVTCEAVSAFFERVHREAGVDVRTHAAVASLEGRPAVHTVHLADGTAIPADVVMYGIGLLPNTELAAEAGLVVDNGIVVDAHCRTSEPHIVAAGDCTNHPSRYAGRSLRLESVQNALEQGRTAARTLLGSSQPYDVVPWFWSDQYDCKLQMVGLSGGHDTLVLRGDATRGRDFAVFYLKDGHLVAADTVSRPQEFLLAKKWVAEHARLDAMALADERNLLKLMAVG